MFFDQRETERGAVDRSSALPFLWRENAQRAPGEPGMAQLARRDRARKTRLLVETANLIAAAHAVVIVVVGTGNKLCAGSTAGKLKVGHCQQVMAWQSSAACRIAASVL